MNHSNIIKVVWIISDISIYQSLNIHESSLNLPLLLANTQSVRNDEYLLFETTRLVKDPLISSTRLFG
jgi:hypothetical protein